MKELKQHPPYKNAVKNIVISVEENGYGALFKHNKLKEWMEIKEPKTIAEYKKTEFDYLSALDKLKDELLHDYHLFLANDLGKGYRVLHPDEQISNGVDKHIRKAQQQIIQATRVLTYVNDELLSIEGAQVRMRKMERAAFLQSAFKKKSITQPEKLQQIKG